MSRDPTEPAKCRSCGADILWAKTRAGKNMPVDAVPDNRPLEQKGGGFVLTLRTVNAGKELHVEKYFPAKHDVEGQPARNRYTAHWATCPNAEQHRRAE